ncbi:pimeloyl-ACP methyl ester carboxylesterase [Flavobacterium cutihirudinis]|uniref:Pimeloyl-ACP methyl ester carboxylesterase n=1 Tax=Flavobacterium cutihirudinis TaxID=1265740 RepID=A0A3D9G0X4_9FLAO|nr:alpha/beta hydrolase [Flavobacterium cutihirudinis]RED26876.1 pimeloyl-ACP methyl ester carboxylesterase [Flavobacterium cutihirudinis]
MKNFKTMKKSKINAQSPLKTISKLFLLLFTTISAASCTNDENATAEKKSPVVLVHGAWQASYVWDQTETDLKAAGYDVTVVKLPGHGDDTTPAYQVSFKTYVDEVKKAINSYNEPVILIGHSLGGAVITQTAAEVPQKIKKLVYVAGFIPQSGKSVLDYSQMDKASLLPASLQLSEDQTLAGIVNPEINLPKIFSQDATEAQKQFLIARYKAEPTIPLGTPLNYKAEDYNLGGKKYYIFTTADNTITYNFQQEMAKSAGITNTYTINSGHSPFISKSPELTTLLKEILLK